MSSDPDAYCYFYYPNKSHLVNNALLSGLSSDQISVETGKHVNRATLDFLISHMPVTSTVNSLEEKIRLVEGALMTLVI